MSTGRRNTGPRTGPAAGARIQQAKLVLLGDQGVGKSSIALRFVRGQFPEHSEATVGGMKYLTLVCFCILMFLYKCVTHST